MDKIHTQSNNLAKKLTIETQKISKIQPQSVFEYLNTTENGLY